MKFDHAADDYLAPVLVGSHHQPANSKFNYLAGLGAKHEIRAIAGTTIGGKYLRS